MRIYDLKMYGGDYAALCSALLILNFCLFSFFFGLDFTDLELVNRLSDGKVDLTFGRYSKCIGFFKIIANYLF